MMIALMARFMLCWRGGPRWRLAAGIATVATEVQGLCRLLQQIGQQVKQNEGVASPQVQVATIIRKKQNNSFRLKMSFYYSLQ
jgi:hypothetical protein